MTSSKYYGNYAACPWTTNTSGIGWGTCTQTTNTSGIGGFSSGSVGILTSPWGTFSSAYGTASNVDWYSQVDTMPRPVYSPEELSELLAIGALSMVQYFSSISTNVAITGGVWTIARTPTEHLLLFLGKGEKIIYDSSYFVDGRTRAAQVTIQEYKFMNAENGEMLTLYADDIHLIRNMS